MIRFAFTLIFSLAAFVSHAQEHFQFLGLSIGGSLEQFADKLVKEKGFVLSDTVMHDTQNINMEMRMLKGSFESFDDCIVLVRQVEGTKETSSVVVVADTLKYGEDVFEEIIAKFDKIYGEHTGFWFNDKWDVKNGRIVAGYEEGYYAIAFIDKSEVDIRDKVYEQKMKDAQDSLVNSLMEIRKKEQTVREICGVPFGSSYEKTKEMLENKYGYPEYYPDRTVITYKHKTYAGFTFDSIHFLFQSDGVHSYLNGCVFIMDAKSLSDAKKKQEMLHKKLSDKYFMIDETDSNGNKIYLGGYPPTPDDEIGFFIEILKYDSELAKLHSPYAARLAYGRYNYVKEEF